MHNVHVHIFSLSPTLLATNSNKNYLIYSIGHHDENYSQDRNINTKCKGDSGNEHMYHVLEKPDDNDHENPNKGPRKDGAPEYESALLKEI